ncbi:hypothetical protein HK102_004988, partial [Quaeritorhiza haematococci]
YPIPKDFVACDPTVLAHICVRPNVFVSCGPSTRSATGYEFLFGQSITCPQGTVCRENVWEGISSIVCARPEDVLEGGEGPWPVLPEPEKPYPTYPTNPVGPISPVTGDKCDATKNVARCTNYGASFQLCYRTAEGDFYSQPIDCNPATSCQDTLVNGVTSAGCTNPFPPKYGWEKPSGPYPTPITAGNDECDVSLSAARCAPGSNKGFQLCSANPIGDGSFLYGTFIECPVGTVCSSISVNGVGSVICAADTTPPTETTPTYPPNPTYGDSAPPAYPTYGETAPSPYPSPNPTYGEVPPTYPTETPYIEGPGLLTSTPCNTLISIARCDPNNVKGVQLCQSINGPQGFYTRAAECGAGTVCRDLTVNNVGSAICDFPNGGGYGRF